MKQRTLPARWPLINVLDRLILKQADHCCGSGDLDIIVTVVPKNADLLALEWVWVRGVKVSNGKDVSVLCRVVAIREYVGTFPPIESPRGEATPQFRSPGDRDAPV